MLTSDIASIEALNKYTLNLHSGHFKDHTLMPIFGGGRIKKPDFMFVFINPTRNNISTNPDWQGIRAPFIGTKHIWRIFNRSGMFSSSLIERIEAFETWTENFALEVYNFLDTQSFYLTNLVKWAGHNADLPDTQKIKLFLPILLKEIEIVKPKHIVTFGQLPFSSITKQKLRLVDFYNESMANNRLKPFVTHINNSEYKVIPCYFPIGRGNPKRAVELLKILKRQKSV